MEDDEQKSPEQLWQEFLDITNKQLAINTELKDIAERFTGTSPERREEVLTEETASKVRDLFIELEALQGEERAVYHSLFGSEDDE